MKTTFRTWINISIPCAGVLFLLCFSCPAPAGVYKYVDSDGTIHFTNVPTHSGYTLFQDQIPHVPPILREEQDNAAMVNTSRYDRLIKEISRSYDVSPALVKAVIKAESGFDPNAVSPKGAQGLMQLMPETSDDLKVYDAFYPRDNIDGGVKFLKQLMSRFDNDLPLALAAYNAGPETVAKYEGIPPYEETRHYLKKVLQYYEHYLQEDHN
jgi:hypothetical protein